MIAYLTPFEAIGCIDESGTTKSGKNTAGVGRQYNGNRGKVDNCVVGVHLSYWAPGFQVVLDSTVYLPEDWANDSTRRKKNYIPEEIEFQTKPQIALDQIDRALSNGVRVSAWTFDELHGRDGKFLDGVEARRQVFVGEIPVDSTAGCGSKKYCSKGQKTRDAGVRRDIRVWPRATTPARFATWPSTRPSFASSRGNGIASRTRTKAPMFGKSNGPCFGAKAKMVYQLGDTVGVCHPRE